MPPVKVLLPSSARYPLPVLTSGPLPCKFRSTPTRPAAAVTLAAGTVRLPPCTRPPWSERLVVVWLLPARSSVPATNVSALLEESWLSPPPGNRRSVPSSTVVTPLLEFVPCNSNTPLPALAKLLLPVKLVVRIKAP